MNRKKIGRALGNAALLLLLVSLTLTAGCGESSKLTGTDGTPVKGAKLRWGAFFGSPFGMKFTTPEHLGVHRAAREINGMLYTCRGGFIDVGHVREAADRTAFIKNVVYQNLINHNTEFSFNVIEPSRYYITIAYPANWENFSQSEREVTANEIAIDIGQYLAHTSMVWHEIITWYGFATVGIFPDTISAFSWEDPYSDVLGTWLGAAALRDVGQKYNDAMTSLLNEEMKELGVQPAAVARQARKMIQGKWYTGGGYFFVKMRNHNFDVGYDDGMVSPLLVPGICDNAQAKLYPAPKLELVWKHGFGFNVEIEPRVMQKDKIYSCVGLDSNRRICPNIYFTRIIEQLKNDTAIAYEAKLKGEEGNAELSRKR
ncbi:MAG: hypothetical protein A2Y10_05150 [Planctomycetes bacterium GWF2_41_51]|nr:MAG: hypothetical protein A2Y10_05150 [Planctomycetes bacterium GWF2_41_51]HBG25548.1 hypothetical protein [Phycisphaerales bacterium]